MELCSENEQCKTWEEQMYWKHFHAIHFYQVLPKDFHDHLVLPPKFAEQMSRKIPNKVSLMGPGAATWDVEVLKTGSLALAGDGWKDFAKAYNLKEKFILLFEYERNSSFKVLIFDQKNLCEKESSYFVKKVLPDKPNARVDKKTGVSEAATSEMMENNEDKGGSEEHVPSKRPKKGTSEQGHKSNPEDSRESPLDSSFEDICDDPEFIPSDKVIDDVVVVEVNEMDHNPTNTYTVEKQQSERDVLSAGDNCNVLSAEVMNGDDTPASNKICKSDGKRRRTVLGLPKPAKKLMSKGGTKRLSSEYVSNRRPVTAEEIENALKRASEARIEGSFIAVMSPTCVYEIFSMRFSEEWVLKNLPRRHQKLILRVGEKTWEKAFYYNNHRVSSGPGWKNFALENNLEDSDVCLFKPVYQKHDDTFVLDVQIFRVVEEITPLVSSM